MTVMVMAIDPMVCTAVAVALCIVAAILIEVFERMLR